MQDNRPNPVLYQQLSSAVTLGQQQEEARRKEWQLAQPAPNAGFIEAVKRFFLKYAKFNGRASRREYWFAQLFILLVATVASALYAGGAYLEETGSTDGELIKGIGEMVVFSFLIACFIPSISVLARQLHDANMSAGFLFLLFTPGLVALPIMAMMPSNPLAVDRFPGLTREERAERRQGYLGAAIEFSDRLGSAMEDQQSRTMHDHQSHPQFRGHQQPTSSAPPPTPTHRYAVGQTVYVSGEPKIMGRITGLDSGPSYYVEFNVWGSPSRTVRAMEPNVRLPRWWD